MKKNEKKVESLETFSRFLRCWREVDRMYERNVWKRDRSDEELIDDALKCAYPVERASLRRFQELLARIRMVDTNPSNPE